MKWGIKFAGMQAYKKYGELAEEADIWITSRVYKFDTEQEAMVECDALNSDHDGRVMHVPTEIADQ